jgi:hypothetical protein
MKQDSWDSLNKEQKFIVADNTIIEFLTPEELEALSEAEQAAEHAKATQSSLWEKVKGRNVSDWRESEGSEIAEILSQLDPRCQMWRENTGRSALTRRRRAALFPGPVWTALLRDDPIKVAIH